MILDLVPEKVTALRQIFHRALQHSGIDVAEAVVHFNMKLREAERLHAKQQEVINETFPRKNGGAEASASATR